MCKAKEISSGVSALLNTAIKERQVLRKQLSELDKELADIYHDMEDINFNACQGYKIAKYIKEIAQKRREVKRELYALDSLFENVNPNNIKQKFDSAAQKADKVYKTQVKKRDKISKIL